MPKSAKRRRASSSGCDASANDVGSCSQRVVPLQRRRSLAGFKDREPGNMRAQRSAAAKVAEYIIKSADSNSLQIADSEVLDVLRMWKFKPNRSRRNVIPHGQSWVHSDTLGLSRSRQGKWLLTQATRDYPDVVRLLCRWLNGAWQGFPCTSISVNGGYAARRHRDQNNHGPSLVKSFGKFEGGCLRYWQDDDRKRPLDRLPADKMATIDVRETALFDGRCAHEVEAFSGERFSVVFFTVKGWEKTPKDLREALRNNDVFFPTVEDMSYVTSQISNARGHAGQRTLDELVAGCTGASAAQPPGHADLCQSALQFPQAHAHQDQNVEILDSPSDAEADRQGVGANLAHDGGDRSALATENQVTVQGLQDGIALSVWRDLLEEEAACRRQAQEEAAGWRQRFEEEADARRRAEEDVVRIQAECQEAAAKDREELRQARAELRRIRSAVAPLSRALQANICDLQAAVGDIEPEG